MNNIKYHQLCIYMYYIKHIVKYKNNLNFKVFCYIIVVALFIKIDINNFVNMLVYKVINC